MITEKDQQAISALQDGWDLLMNNARIIAMLPLEDWILQFAKADAIAPIVDPTLYREYIYSGKGEIIKSIIEAAIPLKAAVLKAQPKIIEMLERHAK